DVLAVERARALAQRRPPGVGALGYSGRGGIIRERAVVVAVETAFGLCDGPFEVQPFVVGGGLATLRWALLAVGLALGCDVGDIVHLEQRVALELGFDELAQLEVRELKQANGL